MKTYAYFTKAGHRAIYGSVKANTFLAALEDVTRRWPGSEVQSLFYRPANSSKSKTSGRTQPKSPDKSGTIGMGSPVK